MYDHIPYDARNSSIFIWRADQRLAALELMRAVNAAWRERNADLVEREEERHPH